MVKKASHLILLLLLIFLLAGCQAETAEQPEPIVASPEPTAVLEVAEATEPAPEPPTAVPTEPTAEAVETVETERAETAVAPTIPTEEPTATLPAQPESGRTEEGAFYMGNPSAPIRLIDYSDFM